MNRTTTVVVALIAAAGLSTMAYTVPEQRALAWGGFGGCGFGCGGFFDGCGGFGGCGGGFFVHKTIIQTIHQVNNCTSEEKEKKQGYGNDDQDQNNNNNNKVVCVNTATNTARNGFGGGFGLG